MHELSIAQALIEHLNEIARREGASSVRSVTVRVGALAGVDPEALQFAFPLAAAGSSAEGAELRIEPEPASARCRACGASSQPSLPFLVCEACGSGDVEVSGGRELLLTSAELST